MFKKKKNTIEEFWSFFQKNKDNLEKFIRSENQDYSIYNKQIKKLKQFNTLLFPEITIDNDGDYVLIITPDGIKAFIEPTKELVEKAPNFEKWKIKKFRQPSDKFTLNFQGLEYLLEDIKIWRKFDLENEVVDIAVLINGYKENDKRYENLAFLYLDHILGEFNVLTRVGSIDFMGWDKFNDEFEAIDLVTLRNEIAEKLY